MGNTCKPMAVSFQCMTKFTTKKRKESGGSLGPSPSLMRSQCQPTSSWSGHRNANGASQVAERGAGLWCPGPPTCVQGQPSSQESCSGPGPEAPEPPCHLLAQALVTERPRLLSLWSKGQVLGSKQAELALGGVSKKGIFFFGKRSGAHQAFGRLPRNGRLLEWSWRAKPGGQCLIFKQEMLKTVAGML